MKLTIGLLITFCACCSAVNLDNNARIVGGDFASKNQFPHQVALLFKGSLRCGGSILSESWILTAAHCVAGLSLLQNLSICAGTNSLSNCENKRNVSKSIPHEEYGNFKYDIALLELEEPLKFSESIKSIQIVTQEVPIDSEVIITGWGKTSKVGDISDKLKYNTLNVSEECTIKFDGIICLGHERNNGACNGDSGGSAMYQNKLVGVANYVVYGCGSENADGYAKVSFYADWIRDKMDFA